MCFHAFVSKLLNFVSKITNYAKPITFSEETKIHAAYARSHTHVMLSSLVDVCRKVGDFEI